jgi:hypothetical protein
MEDGNARVLSSTDATVWYDVNGTCSCPDAQYRKVHCKHLSAWKLYQHIQHQVDTETPPAPLLLPPAPAVVSPAPESVTSEALFSITLKGLRFGQDALVTARGQTWEAFQTNLAHIESLLDAPGAAPAQGPPPPPTTPQCPTHGPMKVSTKARGWYCPQKLEDDTWCQSKQVTPPGSSGSPASKETRP